MRLVISLTTMTTATAATTTETPLNFEPRGATFGFVTAKITQSATIDIGGQRFENIIFLHQKKIPVYL